MPPLPLAVRLPAIIKNNGSVLKSNPVDENTYVPFRLLAPKPLLECSGGVDELLLPPQAARSVSPKRVRSRTNPLRAKSAQAFLPINRISGNRYIASDPVLTGRYAVEKRTNIQINRRAYANTYSPNTL
jgi:hypothetical protein